MDEKRTLALVGTIAAGLLASTAGADIVAGERLSLGLAVGGSAVAWIAILVWARLETVSGTDERMDAIWYRAGFYGWIGSIATGTTLLATLSQEPDLLSYRYALIVTLGAGILALLAATSYYERTM